MLQRHITGVAIAVATVLAAGESALAGPTDAQKCTAKQLLASGNAAKCLFKAGAKAAQIGDAPSGDALDACQNKLSTAFSKAETAAGGDCPGLGDAASVGGAIQGCVQRVEGALSGTRFVDNGDGTVTDNATGILWEKKIATGGCLHCMDVDRSWNEAMTTFIGRVNGLDDASALGGRRNWGLPTIEELLTIFDCGSLPCTPVDPLVGPGVPSLILHALSGTYDPGAACAKALNTMTGNVDCLTDLDALAGASRARVRNNAY